MYISLFDESGKLESQDLTSGWLLSETISKLNLIQAHNATGQEHMQPISLSTIDNKSECIDFYLTQMQQPLYKFFTISQNTKSDMILAD